ncbi:MAG: CGNR zinc finger domain-containing protein [Xanthobacteraceae bacterium]
MPDIRPAPFFIGDDLALDFLNSVAAPAGGELEWLDDGDDLLAWLEAAHAVPTEIAGQFRKHAAPRALDAVAAQARELREWFRSFVSEYAGTPLHPRNQRELAPLNALLARDQAFRQIEIAGAGKADHGERRRPLRWHAQRHWDNPKTLLLPIAEAMGDLICERDFTLVRKCEGPTCTLWFLDVSKAHVRRWCSMAVCGNRAKAAAHRARARSGAGS